MYILYIYVDCHFQNLHASIFLLVPYWLPAVLLQHVGRHGGHADGVRQEQGRGEHHSVAAHRTAAGELV